MFGAECKYYEMRFIPYGKDLFSFSRYF